MTLYSIGYIARLYGEAPAPFAAGARKANSLAAGLSAVTDASRSKMKLQLPVLDVR